MATNCSIAFDNSYARLPGHFYARLKPEPVPNPTLVRLNHRLAAQLGLDSAWLQSPEGTSMLAGNSVPAEATPIAMAYAGHQFGGWVPQLGDGRAILLGELLDVQGERYDVQLKGSGRTPYSRNGDGRSPIGPVLREYIVSEAMAALGVPTTRALSAVVTEMPVLRERPFPGGVLARVARSHIRVGTFEYFAAKGDEQALRTLVDYVLMRHYPTLSAAEDPAMELLRSVVARQADLIARWQLLGFIHGVMNTDNMLVSGETIDYGPCAFMDVYHPQRVFSSIDHRGRYAYCNQPGIATWNLACLAGALLPLFAGDREESAARAKDAIESFHTSFSTAYRQGAARKLGLTNARESDDALFAELLETMTAAKADFTLTFSQLTDLAARESSETEHIDSRPLSSAFGGWLERWRRRLGEQDASPRRRHGTMVATNPRVIPRTHLIEEAIAAAVATRDFGPFHALVEAVREPFAAKADVFVSPPRPDQVVRETFCGT